MKKIVILALALLVAAGCLTVKQPQFTLTVDPPDAQIDVIRGDLPGTPYHSPAKIPIPTDHTMAAQSRVVISHKDYKTTVLLLSSVQGDSIRISLQKAPRPYRLKYGLAAPAKSDDLTFRDKMLAVTITPRDQQIDLKIDNLSKKPLTILWDMADYTDVMGQSHRVVPADIRGENRGNRVPPQTIPVGGSLQASVMPENSISYSGGKKGYVVKPLFDLDSDSAQSLKGKTVGIFLPVAVDGALIPDL